MTDPSVRRGGPRRRHRQLQHRRLPRAVPRLARRAPGRHRDRRPRGRQRLARRQPHARPSPRTLGPPDREPDERVPLAGVEPGDPRDDGAVRPAPEPRRRDGGRNARRLPRGRRARTRRAGHRRAAGPQLRRHDVPERPRRSRASVDAVGHAFLGPFAPGNRSRAATTCDGWDRTHRARGRLGLAAAACCCRAGARARSAASTRGSPSTARSSTSRRGCATRAGRCCSRPRSRSCTRSACRPAARAGCSLMHSRSIYRYYRKHRAPGGARSRLPFAWVALRARAELEWLPGERWRDEGGRAGRRRGHPPAPAHRDDARSR